MTLSIQLAAAAAALAVAFGAGWQINGVMVLPAEQPGV